VIIQIKKCGDDSDVGITEKEVDGKEALELELSYVDVLLKKVYTGIGIETDQGLFGIAMRDDGIEVLLNGKIVWSSTCALGNAPVSDDACKEAWEKLCGPLPTEVPEGAKTEGSAEPEPESVK
jgi:hypothetical protein